MLASTISGQKFRNFTIFQITISNIPKSTYIVLSIWLTCLSTIIETFFPTHQCSVGLLSLCQSLPILNPLLIHFSIFSLPFLCKCQEYFWFFLFPCLFAGFSSSFSLEYSIYSSLSPFHQNDIQSSCPYFKSLSGIVFLNFSVIYPSICLVLP